MQHKPHFAYIPLDQLEPDRHSTRLPNRLKGAADEELLEYMLLDASVTGLILSIGRSGIFAGEPLLVVKGDDGTYKVIDGNRRLFALRVLSDPSVVTVQLSRIKQALECSLVRTEEIPCIVFEEEAAIRGAIAYKHITGSREWKTAEKAGFLYQLWQTDYKGLSHRVVGKELAARTGTRAVYIMQILIAYEVYRIIEQNRFFKIDGLNEDSFRFQYLLLSLRDAEVAEFLGVTDDGEGNFQTGYNPKNICEWTLWFFKDHKTRMPPNERFLRVLSCHDIPLLVDG